MGQTSDIAKYYALVDQQIGELEAWVASDADAMRRLVEHIGSDRTVRSYCDEYCDKYAIVAYLATDIDYPGATVMLQAYQQFSSLIEEIFE